MTADDAAPETRIADEGDAPPSTVPERLLGLQRIDTEADQLRVRRERLPEREQVATRSGQLASWEKRRSQIRARIDELTESIEAAETRGTTLTDDKRRLEAQLKTVIAPREAEALMHEIATIDGQRDELDTRELDDLTEQTTLEDELAAHLELEPALRAALGHADDALTGVVVDIDRELDGLETQRAAARSELDAAVLARYDHVRSQLGVAVAKLEARRCAGCHLDLSAAEVDTAKEESGTTGYTDCPQCGRLLVV